MAPRLSRLVSTVALAAVLGASSMQAQAPSARRVFSREEIGTAGIVRIGELLRLAPWTSVRTVDEFAWRATDGVTPLEDDRWVLVVDGQLVEPGLLGVTGLSRVPLDLHAIDSVAVDVAEVGDFHARPGAGRIEIYSHAPRPGVSGGGRFATGSETGDPGPFAFTPPAVPNQDRFGHDAALAGAFRSGGWSVSASVGFGVHVATDPAIADRLLATGAGFPRIEYASPSVRLVHVGDGGEHRLLVGRSRQDDWFRVEAVGIELPGRLALEHAGASGLFRVGRTARLHYTVSAERTEADFRATPVTPSLAVDREGVRAGVALDFIGVHAGIAAAHRSFRSDRLPADDEYTELRAFGRLALTRAIHFAGSIDRAPGRVGPAVELGARWRSGPDALTASLGASKDIGRPHDALWPLTARGFTWLTQAGVPVSGTPGAGYRDAKVEVQWFRRLGSEVEVAADASARLRRHGALPLRALAVDTPMSAWRGPVTLVSDAASRTGTLGATLAWRVSRAAIDAEYRMWWIRGDSAVRSASRAAPSHGGRVRAAYFPARSLELTSTVAVRGSARWEEYGGAAIGRLPAAAIVNVSARKSLWNGRINTHLGLRNLFGAEDRRHPEGADARLSLLLMVDGELGGSVTGR